jgi:predicted nucleic acid-binding protein
LIVVSDATPIISLAKIDMLDIMGRLYDEVLLPKAVYDEVCRNQTFAEEAAAIQKCTFMNVKTVNREQSVKLLRASGLDLGESEAIVLADSLPDALLLMDERKGRQIALNMGIQIIGTLGILLHAKKIGLIPRIKPLLDSLLKANIRISESLYYSILEQANEK